LDHNMLALVPSGALAHEWLYAPPNADDADSYSQVTTWAQWPECVVGREQSPINIVTAHAAVAPRILDDSIDIKWPIRTVTPKNNKHAFQIHELSPEHYTGDQEETGLPKGYTILRNERYNFYQANFHTPSENTIDGKSFAMEAHFLHQLDDEEFMTKSSVGTAWPKKKDGQGTLVGSFEHLAVLSVMFELSSMCNPLLDEFWDLFPPDGSKTAYARKSVEVDLSKLIEPLLPGGYYHWDGSLTTPPCTEGVDWNLFKAPLPVCQRQVDTLKSALGRTQKGVTVNNRVVQPIDDRVVTQTSSGTIWRPLAALSFALSVMVVGLVFALFILCRKLHKLQKAGTASPIVWRQRTKKAAADAAETPVKAVNDLSAPTEAAMDLEKNEAALEAEAEAARKKAAAAVAE